MAKPKRKTINLILWRWNPKEELWYEWRREVVFCKIGPRSITVTKEDVVLKFSLKDGEQIGSLKGQNPNYARSVDIDTIRNYQPAPSGKPETTFV